MQNKLKQLRENFLKEIDNIKNKQDLEILEKDFL
jgi:hypothetical protein